ncbi:hypothetical protein ACSERS_05290 [Pseudomonas aeruginosa]|nr:hypothetical protein [Pseudomonas aeruginosa]HDQ1906197.1 hypothetical protein [Pseudomonas aeruginosa]HDQ4322412.1 hypothetical protein [Pseudomonas aeruginosa]HDU8950866.1 hypothetical protein [Pseudomonas aeruginosa]
MVATSSDKGLLKAPTLDQFKQYLTNIGMEHRPGKGEYQVMQVKCGASWLAVCRDARGHITTPIELRLAVNNFNSGAMPLPKAPLKPPIRAREQFLDDLRDDFAIAAMSSILGGQDIQSDPAAISKRTLAVLAEDAYDVADAMLAERAKRLAAKP